MSKPWRGFIALNGKKAIQSFKGVADEQLLSLKAAKKLDSYGGVLDNDIVLLDFDDSEQAKIAYEIVCDQCLDCYIVQTNRGYHFLFRDGGFFPKATVGQRLACGLKCDIKLGNKNGYEVLKLNKEERKVIQETMNELPYAPPFFRPLDSEVDLLHMKEGDGRNDTMFAYMLSLTNAGYKPDECKDVAEIINNYIFDVPMGSNELETVTRDEAFVLRVPVFKDNHGNFKHNDFGDWLIDHANIIKISGRVHIYKDGIYVSGEEEIERKMIEFIPDLVKAKRKEVLEYIKLKIRYNTPTADARYIPFQNGIYDMVDKELLQFSPDMVITNRIPHDYNPKANDPLVLKTLNKMACGDRNIMALFEEIIGYLFWRRNELGASFFLLGDKSNGKSTFISMLVNLLGMENIAALDLRDFNNQFNLPELFGKLANLGDDIADDFLMDMALYKKIVTGDLITVAAKYELPFKFAPYAKLIFSANKMPRMSDPTGAVLRRLIPVQFNATFRKTDPDFDPYIKYKLCTETGAQTLINLGLKGLERVITNNDFTKYDGMDATKERINKTNNPIMLWLDEYTTEMVENHSVDGVYMDYTKWCYESQLKPLSKPSWVSQIKTSLGLATRRTVNAEKKPITLFVRK